MNNTIQGSKVERENALQEVLNLEEHTTKRRHHSTESTLAFLS
jgi:hypothetical protein